MPGSSAKTVTPLSLSPDSIALCTGAAPRNLGNSEKWRLIHPCFGIDRVCAGRMRPYPIVINRSKSDRALSISATVAGLTNSMEFALAH